jgi:hypothetical protein
MLLSGASVRSPSRESLKCFARTDRTKHLAPSRYLKYIVAQLIVELLRWISFGVLVFQAAASRAVTSRQTAKRLSISVRHWVARGRHIPRTAPPSSASSAAVLAEQHDEWIEGCRYLGLDVLTHARATLANASEQQPATTPTLTA